MAEVIPLFEHQSRAVAAAMLQPRLWLNMAYGTGKSRTALEIIKRKKAKALVIAPLTLIETSWRGDWERFGYKDAFPFCHLSLSKRGYLAYQAGTPLDNGNPLDIINPESFIRMSPEQRVAHGYDTLIIDEASKLKTRTTKISKAVYEMSKRVKNVYLLSGNLAPNSEEEYYSPIRCLDEALLGSSYYGFLNTFFIPSIGHAPGGVKFKKWDMNPAKRQDLADKLKRVSIRIGKEDAPELPSQAFITREVELEPEQRKVYETIKRDKIIELQGKQVVALNILSEMSKLRQAASGFVFGPDGRPIGVGKAKLDALRSLLEEIGPEQVVIFSCWQEEIRQIQAMLGERCGVVYGEASELEKVATIKAFQGNQIQYVVCHPRSGGIGTNFQNACYAIYASLDYSLESFQQSLARIHRSGQTRPCTYTFLLARNTIDSIIHAALQKKQDISNLLLGMLKEPANAEGIL